jgi:hypothetical protein
MMIILILLLLIVLIGWHITIRYTNASHYNDAFSQHINAQNKKRFFSGMHQPFMPTAEQRLFFEKHFSEYQHLLPQSLAELQRRHCLKTSVSFKALSECPVSYDAKQAKPLAVGGPAALMWAISLAKQNQDVTYLNNDQAMPIAYASAWHLEEDAETEAPTTFKPTSFLSDQLLSIIFKPARYTKIESSGLFSWQTLDWIGWLRRPTLWLTGIKIAFYFQLITQQASKKRKSMLIKLAKQCHYNEEFYNELDTLLNHQLLLSGQGSIIIARTDEEVRNLSVLRSHLKHEKRSLKFLSDNDLLQRYGFVFAGKKFAEKSHDRILSPNFMQLCKNFLTQKKSQVINATLVNIYIDQKQSGGIAEYTLPNHDTVFLPFSHLTLSLGYQAMFNLNNKPLYEVVSARGVSMLAYIYLPRGCQLSAMTVCGATNHVTRLSHSPVSVQKDNAEYDAYLVRITAGACITPTVLDPSAVDYDASVALGLITAVRQTFGTKCIIEPIFVYGGNRQMSRYGQTHWCSPHPDIHIQYGAGGGGLTRAPDVTETGKP